MFSKVKRVDENVTVEVRELPDSGIIISGTRYNIDTEETLIKVLLFSPAAAEQLRRMLNEWGAALSQDKSDAIQKQLSGYPDE